MPFPNGRQFAFTLLDDTDDSTFENIAPVYQRLRELGFRTTKTVWPLDCPEGSSNYFAADTLQRQEYLQFVHQLVGDGFELAGHGATMESSERERTLRGIAFLEREFGQCPRLFANHGENRENLYWGPERFRTPPLRWLLRAFDRNKPRPYFRGDREGSRYFWGDVCRERFHYVRNFTFARLDALSVNPEMPYRTNSTPYVRRWFSTADAPNAAAFRRLVTREAVDRLEADGGVCIISTHLGKGYAAAGRLDPGVDELLSYVAAKPGWFAPVSEILDHLRSGQTDRAIGPLALARLEFRFLVHKLRSGRRPEPVS